MAKKSTWEKSHPQCAVHCVGCVAVQAWSCDAQFLAEEVDRLNRLVEMLSRALARYQDEEDEAT